MFFVQHLGLGAVIDIGNLDYEREKMMNMKYIIPMCVVSAAIIAPAVAQPEKGKVLTEALCMACHGDAQQGQARLAPPMMMVKRHYMSLEKKEMVEAIMKWVKKPDAKKARMPGAVRRFGLMPPLALPDAQLKAIAEYISKTKFDMPKGCGPGRGQGRQGRNAKQSGGCDPAKCDPTQCEKKCDQGCGSTRGKKRSG